MSGRGGGLGGLISEFTAYLIVSDTTDDYAKDVGPGAVLLLCCFYHAPLL